MRPRGCIRSHTTDYVNRAFLLHGLSRPTSHMYTPAPWAWPWRHRHGALSTTPLWHAPRGPFKVDTRQKDRGHRARGPSRPRKPPYTWFKRTRPELTRVAVRSKYQKTPMILHHAAPARSDVKRLRSWYDFQIQRRDVGSSGFPHFTPKYRLNHTRRWEPSQSSPFAWLQRVQVERSASFVARQKLHVHNATEATPPVVSSLLHASSSKTADAALFGIGHGRCDHAQPSLAPVDES